MAAVCPHIPFFLICFPLSFKKIYVYELKCFAACMYVCHACHVCLVPEEVRRGQRVPGLELEQLYAQGLTALARALAELHS